MANDSALRVTTGQLAWQGVNSDAAPTIAGPENPNGLGQNMLSWANNCTMRGGCLQNRAGYRYLLTMPQTALWGDAMVYDPLGANFPFLLTMIGGRIYKVEIDALQVTDLSAMFGLTMPIHPLPFIVQGEEFAIIQAGDYVTNPLFFWQNADGTMGMRRSAGFPATSYGVTAVNFAVPAVGQIVLVTLTAPYAGPVGGEIQINGKTYQQINPTNVVTLTNFGDVPGTSYPALTPLKESNNVTLIGLIQFPFTAPNFAGTVDVQVEPVPGGTIPRLVRVDGNKPYQLTSVGAAPPGPNQVYLVNVNDTPGATVNAGAVLQNIPELPAAGPMDYYMGRIWLANGREYIAGDIVGGGSGTAAFNKRDSILKMTENTYISLGGAFTVPDLAGNITAIKHSIQLDTSLGEGQLFPITSERVYSVNVVPKRADWAALREPIQRVAQINFGTTSDRSVAAVNGDLFFQSFDGVRSMTEAIRYFEQWGNIPISVEEQRAVQNNNKALLKFGSGINFDNRMLQTALPYETPVGTAHKVLMPLNFDTISTLANKLPPAWEGVYEGIPLLRVLRGTFGGRERAFAFIYSDIGTIELWELTAQEQFDTNRSGEARITWAFETPAFTWQRPFKLKELDTLELWVDEIRGEVEFFVEFRPDQHPCWEFWHAWKVCSPRNNCDLPGATSDCYPTQQYQPGYEATMVLPRPPSMCERRMARPMDIGYSFQFRVTVKGACRIRGLMVHAWERDRSTYDRLACGVGLAPSTTVAPMITI